MPFLTSEQLAEIFTPVPSDIDLAALDLTRIPTHIAVIMDGNGRWAQSRGLPRAAGHKAGVEGVRELIRTCDDLGVRYLTIYSFSTENWSRPYREVSMLMDLFAKTMMAELEEMHEKGVRILTIGDLTALPKKTHKTFQNAVKRTAENSGMTLVVAVNYGSRVEILNAVRTIAREVAHGTLDDTGIDALDEATFVAYLDTADVPDPDLLIRTSGEYRLSNFMLFQIAYTEFYVSETMWPDFDRFELLRAVLEYQRRERRFGGVDKDDEQTDQSGGLK